MSLEIFGLIIRSLLGIAGLFVLIFGWICFSSQEKEVKNKHKEDKKNG